MYVRNGGSIMACECENCECESEDVAKLGIKCDCESSDTCSCEHPQK